MDNINKLLTENVKTELGDMALQIIELSTRLEILTKENEELKAELLDRKSETIAAPDLRE